MNISRIIKENRTKKGLSRAQLAKVAGVSADGIYAWETEKRIPTIDCADKVLKALEISYTIGAGK